jgi:hypothetical protein
VAAHASCMPSCTPCTTVYQEVDLCAGRQLSSALFSRVQSRRTHMLGMPGEEQAAHLECIVDTLASRRDLPRPLPICARLRPAAGAATNCQARRTQVVTATVWSIRRSLGTDGPSMSTLNGSRDDDSFIGPGPSCNIGLGLALKSAAVPAWVLLA